MIRNIILVSCFVTSLSSCSLKQNTLYSPICFSSLEKAQQIGELIFHKGFSERVGYELTGQSRRITGLGLMYAGFDPEMYCNDGQHPVLIYFEQQHSELDSNAVIFSARIVFNKILYEINKQ